MKTSTKKCEREECKKKTPMGNGGIPRAYCGLECFRKSKTYGHLGRSTFKRTK